MYLLGTTDLDITTVFNYELSPVPMSLFKESDHARYTTSKSVLMNKIKHEVSSNVGNSEVVVIDGGGMLHTSVHWPKEGTVACLVDGVEKFVRKYLNYSDVYLIFDRYYEKSIKSDTRCNRIGSFQRSHQLNINSDLPPKDICLTSNRTKEILNELIAKHLLERVCSSNLPNKLMVTSTDKFPEETKMGVRLKRVDLATTFDEADYIIPQQVNSAVEEGCCSINVLSDDTDVFVLLCSFFVSKDWSLTNVFMKSFNITKKVISINETVNKNLTLIPSLISAHAISGCDSVPMMFGVGKAKALEAIKSLPLKCIGSQNAPIDTVLTEGRIFVSKCYGMTESDSSKNRYYLSYTIKFLLIIHRYTIWSRKTDVAKLSARPPTLKTLPPTSESLDLNIRRAHYQALLWQASVTGNPPSLDPCQVKIDTFIFVIQYNLNLCMLKHNL